MCFIFYIEKHIYINFNPTKVVYLYVQGAN